MSYFKNFDRSLLHERWFALLFLCLPLFFLTVKSWSSGVGILLFLSVLLLISRAPSKSFNKNSKVVWINSLVLITPLLCETVATIGRRLFSMIHRIFQRLTPRLDFSLLTVCIFIFQIALRMSDFQRLV